MLIVAVIRSRCCGGRRRASRISRRGLREQGHEVALHDGRAAVAGAGLQPAGERKTTGGLPASRPRRAVPAHQRGRQAAVAAGQPVISVDTKKKELVGDFKNAGREWRPKGEPELVRVHDFKDKQLGKAIPYGDLRPRRRRGLGQRRDRPRHRPVRGQLDPQLVGAPRPAALPQRHHAADHRRLRRLQRQPHAPVEGRAAEARRRDRARDRRLPLPARHQQMEQDRAPPLQLHHA